MVLIQMTLETQWKLTKNSVVHEECGNLKVFVDGGELTRNINEKKRPGVLQAYRCPLCDNCFRRGYSAVSMWNIMNQ